MNPKSFVALGKDDAPNLGRERAQVLCALAEAIIGEDFAAVIGGGPGKEREGYLAFIRDIEDYLNYQPRSTVAQLRLGLSVVEVQVKRHVLLVNAGNGDFTRMTLDRRREVLERLRTGTSETQKSFYTGTLRLVSSFYFGHENVFPSLGYAGVSVDNQKVLCGHPWRPNDPTPVEPCNGADPCG